MGIHIPDATVPLDSTSRPRNEASSDKSANSLHAPLSSSPPLWHTREFYVYYALLAASVVSMVVTTTGFSSDEHPNYMLYSGRLRPGWLGRPMDISDPQYRQFRDGLKPLLAVAILYLLCSRLFDLATRSNPSPTDKLRHFVLPFSLLFLFSLHGVSAFKILALLWCNHRLAHKFAGRAHWAPLVCWGFNLLVLVCNKQFNGYPFGKLHTTLRFLDEGLYRGLIPRWQILFNISILRMISYFMDLHALRSREKLPAEPPTPEAVSLEDFTRPNYLAYVLYPPLYIAGPIMAFSNFIYQSKAPPTSTPAAKRRMIALYACRFAFCWLTMEVMLHYIYVVAIKNSEAWAGFTVNQLLQLGFWNLIVIWFKLLLPWRFFRLWALCDGVDPPENMVRCMCDNYSVSNFWRSWHRSYNLWILKYIYIPMGGSQNALRATALVFTFVAIWHDLAWHMLAWGWAVSIFIIPEMVARKWWPPKEHSGQTWYRHLSATGGVFNIVLLVVANLLGFALGSDGVLFLVRQTVSTLSGFFAFVASCGALFVWTQIMFEYREEELRQGIDRRC